MERQHRHFMLNKPQGYISQFIHNEPKRRNKKMLADLFDFPEGTMAIGRLDKKSEGLLLLTTDGKESERVRSKSVEKEYYILVDGIITEEALEQMRSGVTIRAKKVTYHTLPCKAERLFTAPKFNFGKSEVRSAAHGPTSWVSITITEGRYRQVRKMSAAVGFPVLRLVRVRIGNMYLGDLSAGAVREVDGFELFG